MEKKYAIILFKGKEYLCGHEDDCHYDVSCPVRTFTEGEDDFKIQESGKDRSGRTFLYHGKEFRLVTGFYPNGWPALSLESPDNGELYTVLTVNLEDSPAFGIPDKAFIDTNHNPEAMEFLTRNSLAEDTGYRRKSGWVEYPMARLNLAELYRLSPESFKNLEQE